MSKPYVPRPSARQFYIPPTLEQDFDRFLENDIPNVVMDFILFRDWYDQYNTGYAREVIRGEIYPNSTKSRYENMDNQLNFRASLSQGIKCGDYIMDPQGKMYLLDWHVEPQPNNASTRALTCNCQIQFKRYKEEETDERGFLISEAGWKIIADTIPCNVYRYDGRPEFSSYAGTPGVLPNALTVLYVQYNDKTKAIKIDDSFIYFDEEYNIIDIDRVDVNEITDSGVIKLVCKKKAGGSNG